MASDTDALIARLHDEQVEFWYGGEPTIGPLLAAHDALAARVAELEGVVEAVREECGIGFPYTQEAHVLARDILALLPTGGDG